MNSIVVFSILNTRLDICEVRKLYPKYAMIPTKRPKLPKSDPLICESLFYILGMIWV